MACWPSWVSRGFRKGCPYFSGMGNPTEVTVYREPSIVLSLGGYLVSTMVVLILVLRFPSL